MGVKGRNWVAGVPGAPLSFYRIYQLLHSGGGSRKTIHAKNTLKYYCTDYPLSFQWYDAKDTVGLEKFIDLTISHARSDAQYYYDKGFVTDPVWEEENVKPETVERGNLSFDTFMKWLALEDEARIPLWGKVSFVTNGRTVIPVDFLRALVQVLGDRAPLDPQQGWRVLRGKNAARAMGLEPSDFHSGMHLEHKDRAWYRRDQPLAEPYETVRRDRAAERAAVEPVPAAPVAAEASPAALPALPQVLQPSAVVSGPPQESEVSRKVTDKVLDMRSLVVGGGQPAFYVRRIIALSNGALVWEATSYQPNGPWHVWKADNGQLLALGVSVV